jgi:hypothetical protein
MSLLGMSGSSSGGGGAATVDIGDNVANSLMLNSASSQYLSRTPGGAATNRKIGTVSIWLKRGKLSSNMNLITAVNAAVTDFFRIASSDILILQINDGSDGNLNTTPLYRDPSGHMHICLSYDTTQATAANRVTIEVNGVAITAFAVATYPTLNYDICFNHTVLNTLGAKTDGTLFYDGYFSDYIVVDGQKLAASNFGRTSADTGQWVHKTYAGTYGNNGFRLDFANSADLGNDVSGNNNDWTTNGGISSSNQYTDTPTNNSCVLNQLSKATGGTLTIGNLKYAGVAANWSTAPATLAVSSGKWYWEVKINAIGSNGGYVGIADASTPYLATGLYLGNTTTSYGYDFFTPFKRNNSTNAAYGAACTTNDVIGVALDLTAGTITMYKNNTTQGTMYSSLSGTFVPAVSVYDNCILTANFGATAFAYTPPADHLALCTANLNSAGTVTVSGSFTANASADGPFVFCNGWPTTLSIDGNAVTFGTHADRVANGFKLRTASSPYNQAGTRNWTATIVSDQDNLFKYANAKGNP